MQRKLRFWESVQTWLHHGESTSTVGTKKRRSNGSVPSEAPSGIPEKILQREGNVYNKRQWNINNTFGTSLKPKE